VKKKSKEDGIRRTTKQKIEERGGRDGRLKNDKNAEKE
jgi:hypothetical protein